MDQRWLRVVFILALVALLLPGNEVLRAQTTTAEVPIPRESDWKDYGVILQSGPSGAWDDGLGGAPVMSAIVRKDGKFFFYYVGFDGERSSDGGERHRAIGVATSPDGVRFTKYSGNPIITYLPNNNEEEGAGGMAGLVDGSGNVVLYWTATNAGSATSTSVRCDIRLSVSSDGLKFTDHGAVLRHNDSSVWGYGDELFPLGTFRYNNAWYLYYIAKGYNNIFWDLGLAWGSSRDKLSNTRGVLTEGDYIFGGSSPSWVGSNKLALFIVRNFSAPYMEARTASGSSPHQLSDPVAKYTFGNSNFRQASVYLDRDRNTWFMYYMAKGTNYFDRTIRIKLAPAGPPDTTPPPAPSNLSGKAVSASRIDLRWDAANDPDTGVVIYHIYRDGVRIGSTKNLSYRDTGLTASTKYTYRVSAVNFHGVEGPKSDPISVRTPAK